MSVIVPGPAIRALREERKLSQSELSRKSGIPRETLSRIESGERDVTARHVLALSKALEVDPGWFFSNPDELLTEKSLVPGFLDKLVAARKLARMSQEELSKVVGIDRTSLAQYETGKTPITVGVLGLIAGAVGKPIGWFFSDEVTEAGSTEDRLAAINAKLDLILSKLDREDGL